MRTPGITNHLTNHLGHAGLVLAVALATAACTGGTAGTAGAGASVLANPTTGASGSTVLTPLVGAWVTTITRADLAAAGVVDPGAQNENSGRFTWTFSPDGTWTQVQESIDGAPVHNPVFRGTYTTDGDELVATTEFPEQYRDTGLRYTWTIDGDSVRFDVLNPPDALMPVIVETHPWSRAS